MDDVIVTTDRSILNSVKKLLGIEPEDKSFDLDVMMNINAAIFTLNQLGVVTRGFSVTSEEDTYEDLLGDLPEDIVNQVKIYFVCKTRLVFDPPVSSIVMEATKEVIKEMEWRLNVGVDPPPLTEPNRFGR